ncbi:MAG: divergent polysaccharide deacetylase family protein [bacterium]
MKKKKEKDYSLILFLMLIFCLLGWIFSILYIERSNQRLIRKIDKLSNRLLSIEEKLGKGLPEPKISKVIEKEKKIEVVEKEETIPLKPILPGTSCKIAIILDDGGYSLSKDAISLIKEGYPITVSVIPHLSVSKETAEIVHNNGGEVMLHLPMEAINGKKHEKEISEKMSADEIKRITKEAIEAIPYCVGVNNHRGSKATANKEIMESVLSVVKEKNLYFVDSLTTSKSIAYKLARNMGIPSGKREIFIDNDDNTDCVISYLDKLINVARKNGSAIGIGHITKHSTISVLKNELPNFEKNGIELVPVSALLKQNSHFPLPYNRN